MKFEIEVISLQDLEQEIATNSMGTRYNYVTTLKGDDEQMYDIYVDLDFNESIVAILSKKETE